jgi:hypothetical protein
MASTHVDLAASFSVLGTTRATVAGLAVNMRSTRQRRVVAALVLANGRVVSADTLATAAWVMTSRPGLVERCRTRSHVCGRRSVERLR